MSEGEDETRRFYDAAYLSAGFAAQRLYPNEELLRFVGSHFFPVPRAERGNVKILEIGCGSGANLWMIAREGFSAHGLDISQASLDLCHEMLTHWNVTADLRCASMTNTGYADGTFDAVIDVFSSYCLDEKDFSRCLDEVRRILKPGGLFFSYTPSKRSDTFRNPEPSRMIDASTLDGIRRSTAPFFGQAYPFRFIDPAEYEGLLTARGLRVSRNERIGRTYRNGEEYFEFVSIYARKTG
jgi:SAM-dependent methyltransferase